MIKEAYVSYKIAQLLKEKGFEESSFAYYSEFDDWKILRFWRKYARNPINTFYLCAPTYQMACAWLRKKGYHIAVIYRSKFQSWERIIQASTGIEWSIGGFDSYEDAVEAALKYVLENLI